MKKLLSLTLVLMLCMMTALAQDVILTKSGEEIKAKIQEVSLDVIKYRRFDNLEGPLFSIAKADVFQIKYANGTSELFDKATSAKAPEKQLKIEKRGDWYYRDGEILYEDAIANIIYDSKNKNAISAIKQATSVNKIAKPLTILGVVLGSAGAGGFVIGGLVMRNTSQYYDPYYTGQKTENSQYILARDISSVGMVVGLVGIASLSAGLVLKANGKAHLERAIRIYNSELDKN